MEKQHPINDLMRTTMEKIQTMVDVNTIIGAPIQTDGVTLIPISKFSVGLAGGGTEYVSKHQKAGEEGKPFGGGSGASAKLEPVAFLIVRGDSVKLMPVAPPPATTADRVLELVPELVDKIQEFLEKRQEQKERDKKDDLDGFSTSWDKR